MNNIEKSFIENMGKMEYNDFLMSQLLTVHIPKYDEIAYDELFELSLLVSKDFLNSKYNNLKIPLYEAIEEYIKDNKEELLKKIDDRF